MARVTGDELAGVQSQEGNGANVLHLSPENGSVDVPDQGLIRDAEILRDGQDLVLRGDDGTEVIIDGYFSMSPPPMITGADGTMLTPKLVDAFVRHDGPLEYARADSLMNDASPVGLINELDGEATIIRTDGTTETVTIGTPVYEGDVIETAANGAVNIVFVDESSFAISNDARLAIDEYIYDPETDSGTSDFSMLRGMFVYTSGLIGREDPDDVEIDTPMGSIGIRGTVIAGDVDSGEITVIEGAIVLRSYTGEEMTLASQYETGQFEPLTGDLSYLGTRSGEDLSGDFSSISNVSPDFFAGLDTNGEEVSGQEEPGTESVQDAEAEAAGSEDTGPDEPAPEDLQAGDTQDAGEPLPPPPTDTQAGDTDFTGETNNFDGTTDTFTATETSGDPLPPPPPPPPGDGTTTTDTTAQGSGDTTTSEPAPLLPLDIEISRHVVDDDFDVLPQDVVALVSTTASFSDVVFQLQGARINGVDAPGKFELIKVDGDTAAIKLTAGAQGTDFLSPDDVLSFKIHAATDGRESTEIFNVGVKELLRINDITFNDAGIVGIDESAGAGAVVFDVTANVLGDESPATQTVSWTIDGVKDANGASLNTADFTIIGTGNTAQIKLANNSVLDSETMGGHIEFTVTAQTVDDTGATKSFTKTQAITLNNINDEAPTVDVNAGTTGTEGTVIALSASDLSASDLDTADGTLVYNVTTPSNGHIANAGTPGTPITSFTQADLDSGNIVFVHDGSETVTASFDFTVTDGANTTATATFNVTIVPANDAPAGPITITGTLVEDATISVNIGGLTDADGLSGASYTYQWMRDGTDVSGATGATYTLTDADVGAQMSVKVTYTDDGGTTETVTSASTGTIAGVNDAPVLDLDADDSTAAGLNSAASFTEDGGAVDVVDTDLSLTDVDSTTMQSATATITNLLDGTAESLAVNVGGTGIAASYNSGTGVLTLTGSATTAEYESVLSSLQYNNTSDNPNITARTIDIVVNDGTTNSATATATVTMNAVNDAPTSTADTVVANEDTALFLTAAEFGTYSDAEGDAFAEVQITTLPANGTLEWYNGSTWQAVAANDTISTADLAANYLRFTPGANEHGIGYTSLDFKVGDGTDLSAAAYTLTIDVTADNVIENTGEGYTGTAGADTVTVASGAVSNVVDTGAGNDTITVSGTTGNISANTGDDAVTVTASGSSNTVLGGWGFDNITVDGSSNIIKGEQDDDTIVVNGSNNTIYGGDGADTIALQSTSSGNTVYAGAGDDIIKLNSDVVSYSALNGGLGNDTLELVNNSANFVMDGANLTDIESIDMATDTLSQSLNLTVNENLFTADSGSGNFTIALDGGDTLKLDFTSYGGTGTFSLTAGDVSLTDGSQLVFTNDTSGYTLTVNRAIGANVTADGLLLNLNNITTQDGFWQAGSNNATGFGYAMAAMYDSDDGVSSQDGFDDLLILKQGEDGIFEMSGGGTPAGNFTLSGGFSPGTDINMAIASVGDFNGDGVDDFVVGAYGADTTNFGSGNAKVIDINGNILMELDGGNSLDYIGQSVAGIGDVNGDGYADILVGAPGTTGTNSGEGAAYIIYGSGTYNATTTTVDLSALSTEGVALNGSAANAGFGSDVASAGDFNNDGINDFMVAEPGTGTAYLFYGGGDTVADLTFTGLNIDASNDVPMFNMGDVNGDGITDIAIAQTAGSGQVDFYFGGNSADTSADFTITADANYELVGGGAVGDFNGDGFDDGVVVMQSTVSTTSVDIYVIYGSDTLSGTLSNGTFDGTNSFHMTYTIPAGADPANFDFEINAAGDLNGDGFYDLAIGMVDKDTTGGAYDSDGSVAIIYGRDANHSVVMDGDASDGSAVANTIAATGSNQRLVGSSGSDILTDATGTNTNVNFSAGAGDDTIQLNSNSIGNIDGGGGFDILQAVNGTLDFSGLGSEQIQRIEKIDMDFGLGSGNSVILTLDSIFTMMENSDGHELTIEDIANGTSQFDSMLQLKTGGSGSVTATSMETILGVSGADHTTVGGFEIYQIGSNTLTIESSLFTNGQVQEIV